MRIATRTQIVEAADRLFYERGFAATSFADIAAEVQISRGNFYHHFKTKDDILAAVIGHRLDQRGDLLGSWQSELDDPKARIGAFIDILVMNQARIMRHGCPVGTLCNELARLGHPAEGAATGLFTLFRVWLVRQFDLLGAATNSDVLALHLLARSQGIAAIANAYRDETFVRHEVELLHAWLDAVAPSPA